MKSSAKQSVNEELIKLANRLESLRLKKGISQDDLAYKSEVSRSLMYNYLRGKTNISYENLVRIIRLGLEVTIVEFFSEGFDKPSKKGQ